MRNLIRSHLEKFVYTKYNLILGKQTTAYCRSLRISIHVRDARNSLQLLKYLVRNLSVCRRLLLGS